MKSAASSGPACGLILLEVLPTLSIASALLLNVAVWPALFVRGMQPVRAALEMTATASVLENLMRREVALAGYLDCIDPTAELPDSLATGLAVYDSTSLQSAPDWVRSVARRSEDSLPVLLSQRLGTEKWRTERDQSAGGGSFPVRLDRAADSWSKSTDLILTDCLQVSLVRALRILQDGHLVELHPQDDASSKALRTMGDEAVLVPLVNRVFHIADTGRRTQSGERILSLSRSDRGKPATALLEGLVNWNLQLTPGGANGRFDGLEVRAGLRGHQALDAGPMQRQLELWIAAYNLRTH